MKLVDLRSHYDPDAFDDARDGRSMCGLLHAPALHSQGLNLPAESKLFTIPFLIENETVTIYATNLDNIYAVEPFMASDALTLRGTGHADIPCSVQWAGWVQLGGIETILRAGYVEPMIVLLACTLWRPWYEAVRANPNSPRMGLIEAYWNRTGVK